MSAASVAAVATAEHCFLLPSLSGPISGGTLYNRELLAALCGLLEYRALELTCSDLASALGSAKWLWVDSLYLAALPDLKQRARGRVALIAHYLPSFVALGRVASSSELSAEERVALHAADAILTTSAFMRDALELLVAPTKKEIWVVEPGTLAALPAAPAEIGTELRAVMIGNVVPGKGVMAWLRALDAAIEDSDRFALSIIGNLAAEPEYAEACQRFVRESPRLAQRIVFTGVLANDETLALLARSKLFVSASRMESYGMALAEARALGIPILAKIGGNSPIHVDAGAGGELVSSDSALAQAYLTLVRDPATLRARAVQARAHAPRARTWQHAASELMAQLATYEK